MVQFYSVDTASVPNFPSLPSPFFGGLTFRFGSVCVSHSCMRLCQLSTKLRLPVLKGYKYTHAVYYRLAQSWRQPPCQLDPLPHIQIHCPRFHSFVTKDKENWVWIYEVLNALEAHWRGNGRSGGVLHIVGSGPLALIALQTTMKLHILKYIPSSKVSIPCKLQILKKKTWWPCLLFPFHIFFCYGFTTSMIFKGLLENILMDYWF